PKIIQSQKLYLVPFTRLLLMASS
ncbi:hypothetical protein D039_1856B, partial [Vibrio parahaemolyticus EKP-028]